MNKRAVLLIFLCGFASALVAADADLIDRIRQDFSEPHSETYLAIVNQQKLVPVEVLEAAREKVKLYMAFDVKLGGDGAAIKGSSLAFAQKHRKEASTNVIAFVVLDDKPESEQPLLLIAPEKCWAAVNVRALGGVKGEALEKRMAQVIFRAFGAMLGAGYSRDPRALMAPVTKIEDYNLIPENLEPEAMAAIDYWASKKGLGKISVVRGHMKRMQSGEVPPLNPERWKPWEERTGKSVREIFKSFGYDTNEVAEAYAAWVEKNGKHKKKDNEKADKQ